MATGLKNALVAWLEAREDFDLLGFLPEGVSQGDLLDPRRLARARDLGSKAVTTQKAPKPPSSKPQSKSMTSTGTLAGSTPVKPVSSKPVAAALSEKSVGRYATVQSLDALREMSQSCEECSLRLSRKHVLFGEGNPKADLMVIADAPGAEENDSGLLFSGPAGELLDKMLGAIQFTRKDFFLVHAVKCHPPDGRHAGSADYAACQSWLEAQIRLIQPRLLFALGKTAGNLLLGQNLSLGDMRSKEHQVFGVPLRVSYHPTALLRNAHWKRPAWEDLQILRKHFDSLKDAS